MLLLCRKNGLAEFPDSVTARGSKHINNLIEASKQGYKSYLLFVVQREDCKTFKIANDIDPEYSSLLTIALKKKVKILCYDCKFSSKGIKLNNKIKFLNLMNNNFLESFEKTRLAGSIAASALDEVNSIIKPGITTGMIDKLCYEFIRDNKAYSAPLYYQGISKVLLHFSKPRMYAMEYLKIKH